MDTFDGAHTVTSEVWALVSNHAHVVGSWLWRVIMIWRIFLK